MDTPNVRYNPIGRDKIQAVKDRLDLRWPMKKNIRPQSRHHLWLYDEDWNYTLHKITPRMKLQPGAWMREMIHRVIIQIREEESLQMEAASRLWDQVASSGDMTPEHLKDHEDI